MESRTPQPWQKCDIILPDVWLVSCGNVQAVLYAEIMKPQGPFTIKVHMPDILFFPAFLLSPSKSSHLSCDAEPTGGWEGDPAWQQTCASKELPGGLPGLGQP